MLAHGAWIWGTVFVAKSIRMDRIIRGPKEKPGEWSH